MASKPASPWSYAGITGGIVDTNPVTMAAAQTGVRNFLSNLQYANKSATASEIVIQDNATVIWRGYAPASASTVQTFTFDPPLFTSVNSPLKVALVTTATATIVSAQGFIDP